MAPRTTLHHHVLILGGGSAGISVAARLRLAGMDDVGVIDPADTHYYQPLWTLVGGGRAPVRESARPEAGVMPQGVAWIKDRAEGIDPDEQTVVTATGVRVSYEYLVICPGNQLNWSAIPGMAEAVDTPAVSSNYTAELAPKTWQLVQQMRRGTAVFTHPTGAIKCAGAPQKIAYLAADYWRRQGVLSDIRVVLVLPTPTMFSVPQFSQVLAGVANRYGIEVHLNSEATEMHPETNTVVVDNSATKTKEEITYDMMHVVPRQGPPDWLAASPVADSASGYAAVDPHTLQHTSYSNVFALGDASNLPTSKTGAAIRKQAPVVVDNLRAVMRGRAPGASYDGYTSCPLTTARNRMLLAEFDYDKRPAPSLPLINTQQERYDMWLLKRYGLPFMYWNLMLTGRA